jgi:hypothetical protein
MAEKLTDRLEGLNKDLSDVIEEINSVSGLLNNTKGADDPVSFILQITVQSGDTNKNPSYQTSSASSIHTFCSFKRSTWMHQYSKLKYKKHKSLRMQWVIAIGVRVVMQHQILQEASSEDRHKCLVSYVVL